MTFPTSILLGSVRALAYQRNVTIVSLAVT